MRIWREARYRMRAAVGIALAIGLATGATAAAGSAQAQPPLRFPLNSTAVSWGDNQNGQLGNGGTAGSTSYAGVSGLSSGVAQISAGMDDNGMALTADGAVWTWGLGLALGTSSATNSTVPVPVPGLSGITQISAGLGDDLALRSDGTVWAWGANEFGQMGDGSTTAAASSTPVQVAGLTGVTQIADGNGFGLALRSDGTVWAWGWNASGQLGDGTMTDSDVPVQVTGLSGVFQIAAGGASAMALRVQLRRTSYVKTVWTWGGNSAGQLGDGTTTGRTTPELVSGINAPSITAIAEGSNSMVLGSDGSVWDWGPNTVGEVGNGTTTNELRPVKIWNSGVIAIAAGAFHSLALCSDGTVLAWGDGVFGTGTRSLVPVPVPGLSNVTQISAGNYYSLAVHQVLPIYLGRASAALPVPSDPAAAAAAQPTAHPGLGRALAAAGPICESRGAQPPNLRLGTLNLAGGAAAWGCRSGTTGPLPNRVELPTTSLTSAGLEGVFCTSAASCWAVGYFERNGAFFNSALRWNGHHWSRVAAPSPGGTAIGATSELFGVQCTSAKNCWAVGSYERSKVQLEEAIHWNGKNWSLVATPTPAGTLSGDFNELFDVACTSPGSCWASGEYGTVDSTGMEVIENQALHWNGKAWSQVTTPNPAGTGLDDANALSDIRCPAVRNCWAVGTFGIFTAGGGLFNEALHWNGHQWSQVGVPDPGGIQSGDVNVLEGLSCTSTTNCWATGSDGTESSSAVTLNEVMHWNGHTWSSVSAPQPNGTAAFDGNTLTGVNCTSPVNCWAVGYVGNFDLVQPIFNEALHWNGTRWSLVSTPDPAGNSDDDHSLLYGVRCTSRTNCWAVGQAQPSGESNRSQLLHWNGATWSAA